MSDKEDIRKALEASRKSGPMDESMVRGTAELSTKNDGGFSQRQQSLAYPKPPSHRTCLMKKACTFQTQQIKRKSA